MYEMGSNSAVEEDETQHIIQIHDVNTDRLASMHKKIAEPPRLLSASAGRNSCCIFRVPQSLVDVNGKSYQPQIVSIGPYHRGQACLKMIEEHKWRYLGSLLSRIQQNRGLGLEHLFKAVKPLELKSRECYSEILHLSSDEFIEMMVLDGCFIIELFRKVYGKVVQFEAYDPLVTMSWILPFFWRDFLRVENQIPYFVLESLFDVSKLPAEDSGPSLSILALEFFNYGIQRPDEEISKQSDLKGRHLLDLVRSSFIPSGLDESEKINTPTHIIYSVSKLRKSGIKFKLIKAESFLVINFRRGVIEMPSITIDDFMSSFLTNCVAYEQCQSCSSKHFTTYATLLDYIVNTSKDVEYLSDNNIIENYFGTDAELARFMNNLGKDVAFDINRCYLSKLFQDVHDYYRSSWHVQWASFKYTYFSSPWSFISALAGLIVLVLTMAQTYYTIYSVYA
ncbi:hypothetical protein HS088_TW03G00819 [Tripterygium wilfordii]|uniref:Uncharacterized protein n=1 Tax=Tripterygium wilfordii TaxID=458696 RepID=A0A7J7DVT4_TRIWF|nr:UPF0481 protein At3g47200 [Tripterygium wilfordii]KAF5750482.1 hypothetical protein HS088_TW03G00819 [Tripterygium wilfordii]